MKKAPKVNLIFSKDGKSYSQLLKEIFKIKLQQSDREYSFARDRFRKEVE